MRTSFIIAIIASLLAGAAGLVPQGAASHTAPSPAAPAGTGAPTTPVVIPQVELIDDGKPLPIWLADTVVDGRPATTGRISLAFQNKDTMDDSVRFDVLRLQGDSAIVDTASVRPGAARLAGLRVTAVNAIVVIPRGHTPLDGQLVLHYSNATGGRVVKTRAIHWSPKEPRAFLLYILVPAILLAVTSVGAAAVVQRRRGVEADLPMGQPDWNFSSSWASNVTVVGSVIGTVLAFTALPADTRQMPRVMYEAANLFWTLLITLAPTLYNFFRAETKLPDELRSNAPPTYHGFAGGFYLASTFTLLAVFGQLATLWWLFTEFIPAHLLPMLAVATFDTLLTLIAIGLWVYGYRTVVDTVAHQRIANEQHTTNVVPKVAGIARKLDPEKTSPATYRRLVEYAARPSWNPL